MKKEQVVEMGQVKRERFFHLKHQLVENLGKAVYSSYSVEELRSLKKEFESRAKGNAPEAFFNHWLFFFYRDQHGKRAIERYNQNNHDEPQLIELGAKWEKMTPHLIQQVDYDERGVIMEDLFTSERFHMPYCETMPQWTPWAGTFCMLEEFDGGFYINGVAAVVSPDQVKQAFVFIAQQMKESERPLNEVVFEYYPEILKELLDNPNLERRQKQHEIIQTELHYHVENLASIAQSFKEKGLFQMDEWDGSSGAGCFLINKYRYEDNTAPGLITLGEIEGNVKVEGQRFIYSTLNHEGALSVKNTMAGVQGAELVEEKTKKIEVPIDAQTVVYSVELEKGVPAEFAHLAQIVLLLGIDQPLPLFNGMTPGEMVANGKSDRVEQWLRQQEFTSYLNLKNTLDQVNTTADFNTVRKNLGLELSPFVTLRENRQTNFILEFPVEGESKENEDFSLMEEIGIPFEEAEKFYVKDILDCFKEKAVGKSQSTYYKYRLGLQTIGYFLSQKLLSSWSDINQNDWEKWLAFNYLAFNMDATMSQVKGFMTVLKSFVAKIDENYGTTYAAVVRKLVKEMEPVLIAAAKAHEAYVPYQERRIEPEFDMEPLFELLDSAPVITDHTVEGVLQVQKADEKGIKITLLGSDVPNYTVAINGELLANLEQGMVLVGKILKDKEWTISNLKRIFPPQAAQYISTAILQ